MAYLLGIDASTQSVSAVLLDITENIHLVSEVAVSFAEDLPEWGAPQGFIPGGPEGEVHADPRMWLAGLDLCLHRLKETGVNFSKITAVSGAGQQHGTVYLNARGMQRLTDFESAGSLVSGFAESFSRNTSPIWMDTSTFSQCREIETSLGGPLEVCRRTGSIAIERFSGPQIRRFFQCEPRAYFRTARIHLVSSFLASVLSGQDGPIDFGDGAGMNLVRLRDLDWDPDLLAATAPELREKLPDVLPSATWIGRIAPYFRKQYGFHENTRVLAFTGDNPSSLVGVGASKSGRVVISLGTSDTFFAAIPQPFTDPEGCGHVFGNPHGGFMTLQCFLNGSLAREEVRKTLGLSWDQFSQVIDESPAGCEGRRLLPFFFPEISPRREKGGILQKGFANGRWETDRMAARAAVEGQFLNMKRASAWMQLDPHVVFLTGGASRNTAIAQVLADVFDCSVRRMEISGSVALGAAFRAGLAGGWLTLEAIDQFLSRSEKGNPIVPNPHLKGFYSTLLQEYDTLLS